MKTPTKHTYTRTVTGWDPDDPERTSTIGPIEVWIVDEGDAWEVWCADCGYRLGTTTHPELEGREDDAHSLTTRHERVMHL